MTYEDKLRTYAAAILAGKIANSGITQQQLERIKDDILKIADAMVQAEEAYVCRRPASGIDPYWIGSAECCDIGEHERKLIDNVDSIVVIAVVADPDLSYEYDEHAVVALDGEFYCLRTSGCSCPSPSETWHVMHGPTTIHDAIRFYRDGDYTGYTLPSYMESTFIETLEAAAKK